MSEFEKDFSSTFEKDTVDNWLDNVDYSYLNSDKYVPSNFALFFMNFIKLVNGEQGESHKTPPFHLEMLDKIGRESKKIANLCHRGASKTTVFGEYMIPFLAIFNEVPGLSNITGIIYVSDTMENGAKSLRKNMEFRYNQSEFLQEWLPEADFTDARIEFKNKNGVRTGVRLFGAKTGIRGTKIFGRRPQVAIFDDLISDEDARSQVSIDAINNTIYNGVMPALDPTNNLIVANGTPFNKQDPMVGIVESGAWDVNVYPICNTFPCSREEFHGSWEDRFSYDFVLEQYKIAQSVGKLAAFYQEYMLRITSEEERLVQDSELRWYSRQNLLENKQNFNFYITTDFATSAKQKADFSVISVWAYNSNGDWFWVDGMCERTTMDVTQDKLFSLVQEYKPVSVGIEVTGQQGGFISLFEREMMRRNTWFNFASSGSGVGIRPTTDKLTRFNMVVPWFKTGKMYFPNEMKTSKILMEFIDQIRLATVNGLKGKDDCIDTISMLAYLNPWKPAVETSNFSQRDNTIWEHELPHDEPDALSSYIV